MEVEQNNYYVYFIVEDPFLNRVKIGKAKNPEDRLKKLQTGNANKLIVYRSLYCGSEDLMTNVETFLHRCLRNKNITGEWFNISFVQIDNLAESVESFIHYLNEKNNEPTAERVNIIPDITIEEKGNHKCDLCGKNFRVPNDLQRHKNRKSPCLIKEIPLEHLNNPYRCTFCNRIFSKTSNLNKHLHKCKFKK